MALYESNNTAEMRELETQPSPLPAVARFDADTDTSFVAEANLDSQSAEPVIARFRSSLNSVQASELKRLFNRLPELDEQSRQVIWQFANGLVTKIFHSPLERLHDASRNGSSDDLLKDFQRLFQLDD